MIIRNQEEIKGSTSADLVETYNALTGKTIKKFESRGIAEARVCQAIMAAENAAGHAGVAKGATPKALTKAELAAKLGPVKPFPTVESVSAENKPKPLPEFTPEKGCDEKENPYPLGSLSHSLWETCKANKAAQPERIIKSPKKSAADKKISFTHVTPTGKGESKLQADSVRAKVMEFIAAKHKRTNKAVAVAQIDEHIGGNSRGHIQKLVEKNHIKISAE